MAELSLTLTNLGHPQQSPPLLFVDNECAIGLATSSVRPKKSKSIDMRLDWLKERVSQNLLRLVFLPGLINPSDFFTKILPVYRHIAALPFLHGTPYYPQPTHTTTPPHPTATHPSHARSVVRTQRTTGTHLSSHHLSFQPRTSLYNLFFIYSLALPFTICFSPCILNRGPDAPAHRSLTNAPWVSPFTVVSCLCLRYLPDFLFALAFSPPVG